MKILGGTTTIDNKLIFYSEKYEVVISKNPETGNFDIETNEHNLQSKNKLVKIPLIRGLIVESIQHFFNGNTLNININDILIFILYLVDKVVLKTNYVADIAYFINMLLIFIVGKSKKGFTQLHGAEHMVANYYNKYNEIDMKDINKIKKITMFNDKCGTMAYGFKIASILLLKLIVGDFFLRLFITTSISYEVFKYQNNKIVKIISYPFIAFGRFIQRAFFLDKPIDEQIKMAIVAIKELEKLEM